VKHRTIAALVGALAAFVGFMGCSGGGSSRGRPPRGGGSTADLTTLSVYLTDAPPELDALEDVRISIRSVEAVGTTNSGSAVRIPLSTGAPAGVDPTHDVLDLKGGVRAGLAQGQVPAGNYRIHITLSDASVGMVSSATGARRTYSPENGDLFLAGGTDEGNGLREYVVESSSVGPLPIGGVLAVKDVLIDFDLAESLLAQGDDTSNPQSIVMGPVMRLRALRPGTLRGLVRSDSGTPGATADDVPLPFASVTVFNRSSPTVVHSRTLTDREGVYVIEGLEQSTFIVRVEAEGHEPFTTEQAVDGTETLDVRLTRPSS
jgi:hypothetical protein